jgi:hypothetical protein
MLDISYGEANIVVVTDILPVCNVSLLPADHHDRIIGIAPPEPPAEQIGYRMLRVNFRNNYVFKHLGSCKHTKRLVTAHHLPHIGIVHFSLPGFPVIKGIGIVTFRKETYKTGRYG